MVDERAHLPHRGRLGRGIERLFACESRPAQALRRHRLRILAPRNRRIRRPHAATNKLSTLNSQPSGGVAWRLRASLGQYVEFNTAAGSDLFAIKREDGQIVRKVNATTADYAMLNQGQLKATAALFGVPPKVDPLAMRVFVFSVQYHTAPAATAFDIPPSTATMRARWHCRSNTASKT